MSKPFLFCGECLGSEDLNLCTGCIASTLNDVQSIPTHFTSRYSHYGCKDCYAWSFPEDILPCLACTFGGGDGVSNAPDLYSPYNKHLFGDTHADPPGDPGPMGDDPVEHPNHYTSGGIECIKAIEASMEMAPYRGYLKGNIMKYIWRYEKKKGVEDLRKARVYLDWLIDTYEMEGR